MMHDNDDKGDHSGKSDSHSINHHKYYDDHLDILIANEQFDGQSFTLDQMTKAKL